MIPILAHFIISFYSTNLSKNIKHTLKKIKQNHVLTVKLTFYFNKKIICIHRDY